MEQESPAELLHRVRRTLRTPEGASLTEHAKRIAEWIDEVYAADSKLVDDPFRKIWERPQRGS